MSELPSTRGNGGLPRVAFQMGLHWPSSFPATKRHQSQLDREYIPLNHALSLIELVASSLGASGVSQTRIRRRCVVTRQKNLDRMRQGSAGGEERGPAAHREHRRSDTCYVVVTLRIHERVLRFARSRRICV